MLHDLDAWLAQRSRPTPGPSLYECDVIVAAQVVWLRFMVQLLRESAVADPARSQA